MGSILGTLTTKHLNLNQNDQPTFDAHKGFTKGRTKRENKAKCEDLISARIPPEFRDYCAHLLLDYQVCRYKFMPFVYKCHHEKHAYLNCEQRDYVLRMKEFERERRLREREIRVKKGPPKEPTPPEPEKKECK